MSDPVVVRGSDLDGSLVDRVSLKGATVRLADLSGAWIHNAYLEGARVTGAYLRDATIDGDITGLTVNGVQVAPLVAAELDRRYPDRTLMRPTDADGYRTAWSRLDHLWSSTIERAVSLESRAPGSLDRSVGGEWSFLQTLRHLVFAIDAWVLRVYLGQASPYHPLGLTHDEEEESPDLPLDRGATPTTAQVLDVWHDRVAAVAAVLAELTDEDLAQDTTPVDAPGYPEGRAHPRARVLRGVLSEAWEHRLFAERDLSALEDELRREDGDE